MERGGLLGGHTKLRQKYTEKRAPPFICNFFFTPFDSAKRERGAENASADFLFSSLLFFFPAAFSSITILHVRSCYSPPPSPSLEKQKSGLWQPNINHKSNYGVHCIDGVWRSQKQHEFSIPVVYCGGHTKGW